jgi:hypothetical protein
MDFGKTVRVINGHMYEILRFAGYYPVQTMKLIRSKTLE